MPDAPYRLDSNRRDKSNEFLNTPQGILKWSGDIMDRAEALKNAGRSDKRAFETAARAARQVIDTGLKDHHNEPALWLRRANLMQLDSMQPDHAKNHAIERATRMLELSFKGDFKGLDIHHPMHLSCMLGLAFTCAQRGESKLSLRLLDIIDQFDPDFEQSAEGREELRERCTPVTVKAYIAPPHRNAVSPSAVPPAILKR